MCESLECECNFHHHPVIVEIRRENARLEAELDVQHLVDRLLRNLTENVVSAERDLRAAGQGPAEAIVKGISICVGRHEGAAAWVVNRLAIESLGDIDDRDAEINAALLSHYRNLVFRAEEAKLRLAQGWTLTELLWSCSELEICRVR